MASDTPAQAPLLETVMTTTGPDGAVNCAAMGVRWGEREVAFWPFDGTRTLTNLRGRGEAVVHLVNDVLLFVQAALGHPRPRMRKATAITGSVIEQASYWREVVVSEISESDDALPRALVRANVVHEGGGGGDQPPGLSRARYAVVEASILASRQRWLGAERVAAELERLQPLIDKTAGAREREAMAYVRDYLAR